MTRTLVLRPVMPPFISEIIVGIISQIIVGIIVGIISEIIVGIVLEVWKEWRNNHSETKRQSKQSKLPLRNTRSDLYPDRPALQMGRSSVVRILTRIILSAVIGFVAAAITAGIIEAVVGRNLFPFETFQTFLLISLWTALIWFILSRIGPLRSRHFR